MDRKFIITLIFLGLAPCFAVTGIAQKFNFKIYSVNNGLPHSQVHDIEQTDDGFIWIATLGGGLTRFDGLNFVSFTKNDGLNSDLVEVVFQDSKQRLWVATEAGGIYQFAGNRFKEAFPEDSISNTVILNIYERSNGELWFASYRGGIFIFDGKEFKRLGTEDGLPHSTVWDFWEREDGSMLIATHDGFSIYDGTEFKNYKESDGLSGEKVFKIDRDAEGDFWFATSNGVTVWDGKSDSFKTIRTINGKDLNYVYDIIRAHDGKIWIGTEHIGLFIYDGRNYQQVTKKSGLSSNYIYSFFEDADGQMWVATDENGVNLFQGEAYRFYGSESGLESEEVLSIHRSADNTLWLGTYEGIYTYDGTKFTSFGEFSEFDTSQEVWDIAELPNGNMLFLMPDNSIYEYDGESFSNYTEEHGLEKWYTYELFVDDGQLWIGTDEGLVKVKESGYEKIMGKDGLASNVVRNLFRGTDGKLWVGTYNGLSVYDGEKFNNFGLDEGLAHSEINFITEDDKGNIWLGTGGGVTLLKGGVIDDTSNVVNFGRKEGMKLLNTQFLWFDAEGNLWQGTNAGIQLLDVPDYWETGNMSVTHYPLTNESVGIETTHKAIVPMEDGKALIGTMGGLLDFEPAAMPVSEKAPKVYLNNIMANSNSIEWEKYADSLSYRLGVPQFPEITLPHSNQSITFFYSGLDFTNSQNLKYRYRLLGFEDKWMPETQSRSATYTNISPGDYTFQVQATTGNGEWSVQPASFSFAIDYPFWRTYWFYLLATLTFLGIGYLYTKFRLQALEKNKLRKLVDEQTRDLQKALEEKETLLAEIHHRVKNNLAVITGLLELQMDYSADEFSTRSLKESQRRVQSIAMVHEKLYQNDRLSEIDFQKYIEELLEILAYSFGMENKKIDINHNVENINLSIDQAIPCGLILNELVSNSFEHAFTGLDEGNVFVTFKENGEHIIFSVSDNGCGLPGDIDSKKNDSLGITLVETLTMQLQGDLDVQSSDSGTEFTITFEKEKAENNILSNS